MQVCGREHIYFLIQCFFFASSEKVGKRHLKEGCISYSEHVATWELMNYVMLEHAATLSTSLGKNVDLNYEK